MRYQWKTGVPLCHVNMAPVLRTIGKPNVQVTPRDTSALFVI